MNISDLELLLAGEYPDWMEYVVSTEIDVEKLERLIRMLEQIQSLASIKSIMPDKFAMFCDCLNFNFVPSERYRIANNLK